MTNRKFYGVKVKIVPPTESEMRLQQAALFGLIHHVETIGIDHERRHLYENSNKRSRTA